MRFSLALDYFNIRVKGQIATLGATNIVSGCYTSEFFPDDPLCDLFDRVNDPGNLRDNQIIEVRNKFVNINQQHNRGIDFTARLNQELGSWGDLTFLGQATYQLEDTFALFADTSLNDNGEAGDPKWIADLNLSWNKRPFTVVYGLDYIGATSDRADIRRTLGEDECGTNAFRGIVCPDYRLERTFYHSASVTMNIAERYDFTIGMSNIFDTKPPRVSRIGGQSGGNFGQVPILGSQYDYLGRRVFANIRARFGG